MAGTPSVWLGALLLVGCGFETPPLEEEIMDGTGDPAPIERNCATDNPSLRLCIDFEDTAALAGDGSSFGHDVTDDGLVVMNRGTENAVQMSSTSRIHIEETTVLDLDSELTLSLWMNPASRPAAGTSYKMLDNDGQYGISYLPSGRIRCQFGGSDLESLNTVPAASWTHVACMLSANGTWMEVLVNGRVSSAWGRQAGSVPKTGMLGTEIGADLAAGSVLAKQFIGGLDNIQVFADDLAERAVCLEAGRTDCDE